MSAIQINNLPLCRNITTKELASQFGGAFRSYVEKLEQRDMRAADIDFDNGVLTITGTEYDDVVHATLVDGEVQIDIWSENTKAELDLDANFNTDYQTGEVDFGFRVNNSEETQSQEAKGQGRTQEATVCLFPVPGEEASRNKRKRKQRQ